MSEFRNEFRKLQEAYFVGMEELDVGQALNPKTIKLPEGYIELHSIGYAIDPESNPMCVYRMSRTTEPYIDLGSKTPIVDFFLKNYPTNSLYALAHSDDSKKIDEYLDLAMATGSGEAEEVSEDLLQKPEEKDVTDVTVEPVKTVAEEEDEELINDETELDEGKMKELHGYIDDGLSAEQIAKKMKLDLKTIKALMKEEEEVNEAKGGKRIANKKMKIKNVSDLKHYIVRNYSITGKDKKDPDELRTSDEVMQAPSWNAVKDILKKNMFDKKEMDNLYNDLINYQLENAKEFLGVEEYEMKDEDND